jgi:D-alanyl-D-alanine carboxypeptidase
MVRAGAYRRHIEKRIRADNAALPSLRAMYHRTILLAGLLAVVAALASSTAASHAERRGALGVADGAVPDGTTVFDDNIRGVAHLDPALLAAVRRAATDAGLEFRVNSGWRSPRYQRHLLDDAIRKYGSKAEAKRWVATPKASAHVSGDAVDIGPTDAAAWLSAHGSAYGLCQIYANEPWHYELRAAAADHGCPAMYADAAHDPRMRRAA